MKKIFKRKKKSASEAGSIGSGLSGSAYNLSPKKDLGKLHRAAFEGDLTKLKSLLKRSDVNQLDKENRTPLHLACANGKYDAVRMLCEHSNINLNLCDNERKSALMKCVQCEHQTCLKILLDKGADASLCDENGNTALHIAASIPNSDICYLLADYHANPKTKNKDGATPLHIAASLGSDEIVKLMISSGVDINDLDENEKSPLMHAAHKGHLTTVEYLLSKNANAVLRDINGWTADDYASMDGHHPISHIIMEHNARKGPLSAQSRQATISRTPQTTPQRLGLRSSAGFVHSDSDSEGDKSATEESGSVSKATDDKGSWASSYSSEDEEPKYTPVKKKSDVMKPKINVMEAMKFGKKTEAPTVFSEEPTVLSESSLIASPASNPFLTKTARQQVEKQQQSRESDESGDSSFDEQKMRPRYDSKSSKGLPVSPNKPPIPAARFTSAMAEKKTPAVMDKPSKAGEESDDNSLWDSPEEGESLMNPGQFASKDVAGPMPVKRPDAELRKELGLDDATMKDLYNDDEVTTDSQSEPVPHVKQSVTVHTSTPKKSSPLVQPKKLSKEEESDSWDDTSSEKPIQDKKSINYLAKSSNFKFDDDTESEPENVKPAKATLISTSASRNQRVDSADDDDDSWNSDMLPNKLHPPESDHLKRDHGIAYGKLDESDTSDSSMESEGSWQIENKKKAQLNNQHDMEKEQRKEEEERLKKEKEAEEARQREEEAEKKRHEEKKKKELEEEERLKEQERKRIEEETRQKEEDRRREEEQRRQEEERRLKEEQERQKEEQRRQEALQREEERKLAEKRKEEARLEEERRQELELEKLNKMNEELERKNAELRKKAQEEEKKRQEMNKMDSERTSTGVLNQSLRAALQNAAEIESESSESSTDEDENNPPRPVAEEDVHALKTGDLKGAPVLPVGKSAQERIPYGATVNDTNLDTLTEETETDEDLSLSERTPDLVHTSALSDSVKLTEEKQNLSLQLSKEQDAVAVAQQKLETVKKENKQLKLKERALVEEKKAWELEKVDMNGENRKLSFEIKNLEENLETVNLKLKKQDERCKRFEEQLQVEREERREQEVAVRDLRLELKNSNSAMKQAELEREELRKRLAAEKESNNLAQTIHEDNFKLNATLQNEAMKDDQVEALEQMIHEKNQELIKVKAERDRYEDASQRYKEEMVKLRSQDADQHGSLVQLNQELNDKLDDKELELRESEEALQLTALQSVQYKQAYENGNKLLAEEKREKETLVHDLNLLGEQMTQLKADLEDARSSFLREQERTRKLEDSQERMREKESDLQNKLLMAETKASRLENELQISQSANKQRAEDNAKWENECDKLREASKENEKNIMKLEREIAEQSGKIEAMKVELHQRESECVQMRQEKEDLQSRSVVSAGEQQDKFNNKLAGLQREHENERVAFETRNVQLSQQIDHWKSEVERIKQEKIEKEEELAEAQQDRIEAHKKLGYADAFSKSASKEQKHLMDENTRVKEENVRLQSQVSLLEQKLAEKSSAISDLQKEVDQFYQNSANANKQIDTLNESQRLAESSRSKMEQQLKETELENIRLKSELESANSWKDRLQESREQDAHTKALLEERVSKLECDKVLTEEKLAAEAANAKILRSEADGHKNMWEGEVKTRSKLEVELSKAAKEADDERMKVESLRNDLTKTLKEKKTYKTKYEQLKREKMDAERRAESYRSAMHNAGRKAADTESECESQISMMDEQHAVEISRREATISKLREQVTDLMQQLKDRKKPYFPEGPTNNSIGSEEVRQLQFENEKLREELKELRSHIKDSYVDKAELESARQQERIKAQATLAPTLDQVNSFLKNQQIAQDFRDQLIQKREESAAIKAAMRIAALEEELRTLKRKQDDESYRMFQRQEAEMAQLYDSAKRKNEVLEQQLTRANCKAEEYKGYWIKERKKFQNFFSNTLGGSLVPNGVDVSANHATASFSLSPGALGKQPLPGGAYSSTPKKDSPDPLLSQLRNKLDATIAQRLSGIRESPSAPNGHISSGSNSGTPRSDGSAHHHEMGAISGHKSAQNEYMSFLLS